MIRRAAAGNWSHGEPAPGLVAVSSAPVAHDAAEREELRESLLAQAYERGWSEGRAALMEEEAQRRATEAERIAGTERSLEQARASLAELHDGLAGALALHAAGVETSAVAIALAAITTIIRPLVLDASIVAAMCAQLADDGDAGAVLEVSSLDRPHLPAAIRGVHIVPVDGMERGRCVLRSARGAIHGDVGERLRALVDGFAELAGVPLP